jgi:cyclophilin family peptidyl-prolyl cis-trans isomerase/HEAT repeat protein
MYKIIIIIFFLFSIQLFAQDLSDSEKQILIYQDTRSLGENRELLKYLDSKNNNLVIKTLYALANISDSSTVDDIAKILISTHNEDKRSAAAFALGQIPCVKSNEYLLKALNSETNNVVQSAILDALGKIGNEYSLNLVFESKNNDEEVLKAKTLSIARFFIRNIKSEDAVSFIYGAANSDLYMSVKKLAAYALYRTRNKELLAPAHETLIKLTQSENELVRMWAFSALGSSRDIKDFDYIIEKYYIEKSWQAKVNILNSLPSFKKESEDILNDKLAAMLFSSYDDVNPNVRHTGLRVTALLYSNLTKPYSAIEDVKSHLAWFFPPDKAVEWQDKCEAILAYGTIFKDDVKQELLLKMSETENEDLIPYIIKSFQFFKDGMVYKELTDSVGARVRRYNKMKNQDFGEMVQDATLANVYTAYVETISALKNKVDEENQKRIMLILTNFTGSKDPSILDVCFTALNDSIYNGLRNNIKMVLLMDYKELSYPKDKDAMIAFINEFGELNMNDAENILKENLNSTSYDICRTSANALKKITGKDYTFKTLRRTDFDWDYMSNLDKKRFATLVTEKGNIKIKLLPEVAPFSVMNFVKLAEKKFYDNTTFPRVVPNFVIQGGDPMNNGYGGPDYSIRSEFSPLHYERGIFGMANDGNDTEGSQFFIMHSPHYHLDGKYTIFGEVVEGMDVVDNIAFSDKLKTVIISEN